MSVNFQVGLEGALNVETELPVQIIQMLPLPPGIEESRVLADWLEMNALIGHEAQASLDDLRDALRTGTLGYTGEELPSEQADRLEGIAADVWTELKSRARRTQSAYPFRLQGSSLERSIRSNRLSLSTYVFCLLLSVLPWEERKRTGYFPDRIFEEISCLVAEQYMGGKSLRFGWPRVRSVLPRRFEEAVAKLCMCMGEGTEFRAASATGDERDAGLDVVAWRRLDERPGKLILFGACATGHNWEQKLNELQPQHFCRTYLRDPVEPEPAKAFFTPQIVPQERWQIYTSRAGMLFDRCRVSLLAPKLPEGDHHGNVRAWMEETIAQVTEESI